MKKSTIWILAAIMAFAFFGLLYLQFTYLRESVRTRNDQFNEAISRSLYQVSRNLELDQTKKYLNQAYANSQKSHSDCKPSTPRKKTIIQHQQIRYTDPDNNSSIEMEYNISSTIEEENPSTSIFSTPNTTGPHNAISKTFFDMQEEQKKRYLYEKDNLNDVITQILKTSSNMPIDQRVNLKNLTSSIRNEIKYNGIDLPFYYEIVDNNDRPIYQQKEYEIINKKKKSTFIKPDFINSNKEEAFSQPLFPNDPPQKVTYLRVYFPTKKDYLLANEKQFMIPAVIFMSILLITFVVIIYITFRQKRLSEMKNDFMNNMTHELKTPVSTISLAAQMLKDGSISKSPDVFKHISSVINDETARLSFQVEKVLQMSLFEKQKALLKMKEIEVNDIVASVANTFHLKVEKFGGELDIDLQATEATIMADKMHFTNVLFNLLDNAVKYRREDVPLKLMIKTWNNNNKLYVSIEDNGIGIKKEDLKKIFDRFYRVSTGNIHDVKGFGLGLAYVKKIIDGHKGSIKIESELGKGSKFIISLPLINKI